MIEKIYQLLHILFKSDKIITIKIKNENIFFNKFDKRITVTFYKKIDENNEYSKLLNCSIEIPNILICRTTYAYPFFEIVSFTFKNLETYISFHNNENFDKELLIELEKQILIHL